MFKNKKKSQEPIIFVFLARWEPIISYNFLLWQALECSEMSSPIIEPIKTILRTHNFFTLDSHEKQLLNFMGM